MPKDTDLWNDLIRPQLFADSNDCLIHKPKNARDNWETSPPVIKDRGRPVRMIRVVWEYTKGGPPLPFNEIRHLPAGYVDPETGLAKSFKCHPRCCNPEHLYSFEIRPKDGRRYKNTKRPVGNPELLKAEKDPEQWTPEAIKSTLEKLGVKHPRVKVR